MKPNWRETGKQEVFGKATRMSLSSAVCVNSARTGGNGGFGPARAQFYPTGRTLFLAQCASRFLNYYETIVSCLSMM